jgi:RNA polymerase sigma factor (sigma-70 family)
MRNVNRHSEDAAFRSSGRSRTSTRPSASPIRDVVTRGDGSDRLDRIQRRDEETWLSVMAEHEPRLRAIGRLYRLGSQDVEDALQRTWASLLTHAPQIRDAYRLGAWLGVTMSRESLRTLRYARRSRVELVGDWTNHEAHVADHDEFDELPGLLDRRRLAGRIWDLVDDLPPRQRALLRLLFTDEELSYAEVSARTGMPVGAIGPTRRRALGRLREMVEQSGASDWRSTPERVRARCA